MKRRRVLHIQDFPTRIPVLWGALLWLYLDRYEAAGWVHGIAWTLFGVCVFAAIHAKGRELQVRLFRRRQRRLDGSGWGRQ